MPPPPTWRLTAGMAFFYVFSGVCQPLIMTLCKVAGLADPSAQLYMLFYYAGPGFLIFTILQDKNLVWPPNVIVHACCIALFDLAAQTTNYVGAAKAGPTIFAIIYSSVTIWTAVFSCIFLKRYLTRCQWLAISCVFLGLAMTARDSTGLGTDIVKGAILAIVGSCMHGATYVMNEAIMTVTTEPLSPRQNSAVQGLFAALCLFFWQCFYTLPRFEELIGHPVQIAKTSVWQCAGIMLAFAAANMIHSWTYSHTLKHFPGGAVSAGVMKCLQAVLVFVATHVTFCGRTGGEEMCFTTSKLISLVTVVGGVIVFGVEQQRVHNNSNPRDAIGYSVIQREVQVDM